MSKEATGNETCGCVHVPPRGYGGAERITDAFVWELTQNRGIEVDLYAACDSECPAARLVTTERRKLASDKKFLALLKKVSSAFEKTPR